jgi:hypothetical protein
MSYDKTYRTFEEFEREELRRMDAGSSTVDSLMNDIFSEELDFQAATRRSWADESDED